jgi:hypothetical protein
MNNVMYAYRTKSNKKVIIIDSYNRNFVESNGNAIFLFSDNLDRSSGNKKIKTTSNRVLSSLYANKKYPKKTQAVIRGLGNAYPISTKMNMKRDFEITDAILFESIIDMDIERILSDTRNKKLYVPLNGFATDKASLPLQFAEYLKEMLWDYLQIHTMIVNHPIYDNRYGILPKPKPKTK